jgi:CheY-like chemotaxis protein
VVWNLLSNAIKFTPSGGRVTVRLRSLGSQVEIAVSDTGQGIAPAFLSQVFDRFRQEDASTSRRTGGMGLGLAIVRHVVELHGGTVTVESAGEGQGSTFTVRLPSRREVRAWESGPLAVSSQGDALRQGTPSLQGVRVLVVDDEPDTRFLLREVLEACGGDVREAGSARQALDLVRDWEPTVIVSDIAMPEEDGYVLIRRLREWEVETGKRIPAIALTAYARGEDQARALLAGYQVHVAKPVEPMELTLVVARAARVGPPETEL